MLPKQKLAAVVLSSGLMISACGGTQHSSSDATEVGPTLGSRQLTPTNTQAVGAVTLAPLPTDTPAPTAIPAATSRGPNLEASDPVNVKLDSGGLQLVEFFRFT